MQAVYTTDWAVAEQEAELFDLFETAFGHAMSPALWRWKHRGQTITGSLVRHDDKIIAFYGAVPRKVLLSGTALTALQIVDVMVHPQYRGILKRKGPFFLAASSLLERFVGHDRLFPIAFGFPSEKHNRLGTILGLYQEVEAIKRVSWMPIKAHPSLLVKTRLLGSSQQQLANSLWQQMAETLKELIIGVRDWEYLQQRYFKHPTIQYQLYLVTSRLTGRGLGIYVVHVHQDEIELLDVIATPKHMPVLIHSLRRLTHHLNKDRAYAWITSTQAALLAGENGVINDTEIRIPHCNWTPGIEADTLQNRWWLMGGDTDFR